MPKNRLNDSDTQSAYSEGTQPDVPDAPAVGAQPALPGMAAILQNNLAKADGNLFANNEALRGLSLIDEIRKNVKGVAASTFKDVVKREEPGEIIDKMIREYETVNKNRVFDIVWHEGSYDQVLRTRTGWLSVKIFDRGDEGYDDYGDYGSEQDNDEPADPKSYREKGVAKLDKSEPKEFKLSKNRE